MNAVTTRDEPRWAATPEQAAGAAPGRNRGDVVSSVLALQRSAGNRAVAGWLARASGDSPAPAPAAGPAQIAFELRKIAASEPLPDDKWGQTEPEAVEITITAVQRNGSWMPQVTGLLGLYSLQARRMPGQEEVTGPSGNTTQATFCEQLRSLEMLGIDRSAPNMATPWYMLEAVVVHEQVHEQHLLPALQSAARLIAPTIEQISIPDDGTMDADAAAAALRADPRYQREAGFAKNKWDLTVFDHAMDDHFGGATTAAEHTVIDPMTKAIRDAAAARDWGECPPPGTPQQPPAPTAPAAPENSETAP